MANFENPNANSASSLAAPNLKFEREDWSLFRTLDGLTQKAGVPRGLLARLVLKELADNGLDEDARVTGGKFGDTGYYIADNGRGIDGTPEEIAQLFSIRRPLISSKLLRRPTRGAVGNGLRVVAGAVLASGGTLTVITRNRRIQLRPERDGSTEVVKVEKVKHPIGTRIEIRFGPDLPCGLDALRWANNACHLAKFGSSYSGKSSPWWYDEPAFHELLDASGERPVRDLIAALDGCSGAKAGEIVDVAGLSRATCRSVTREQAKKLLRTARAYAKEVTPKRLGAVGPDAFPDTAYACVHAVGDDVPIEKIPFVVEAWAEALEDDRDTTLAAYVNRTPTTVGVDVERVKQEINAFGCGLSDVVATTTKTAQFKIHLNIITPFMPITSDGKEPDFTPFFDEIQSAISKAVGKAHRPHASEKKSQKTSSSKISTMSLPM
jgi:hypothetical protein